MLFQRHSLHVDVVYEIVNKLGLDLVDLRMCSQSCRLSAAFLTSGKLAHQRE